MGSVAAGDFLSRIDENTRVVICPVVPAQGSKLRTDGYPRDMFAFVGSCRVECGAFWSVHEYSIEGELVQTRMCVSKEGVLVTSKDWEYVQVVHSDKCVDVYVEISEVYGRE